MKKSRKKMLLSSIAMLLVALVALGTATFAWFTQNKTVSATGFAGKASSALGLKILSESEDYADSNKVYTDAAGYDSTTKIDYYADGATQPVRVFKPVSMIPSATPSAFTTTAANENNYARKTGTGAPAVVGATNPSAFNTAGADYYKEKIYIVVSGDSSGTAKETFKITNLDATFNNAASMAPGVRLNVFYHNADGQDVKVGTYASTDKDTVEIKKAIAENVDISTDAETGNAETVSYETLPGNVDTTNEKFTVNSTAGACYFTVVVFLDGQDQTVMTKNITTANLVSNIQLSVELV